MPTPTELARRWFEEVWNDRREATVDELMAARMEGYMEGADIHTPADFKAARRQLLDAFPDLRIKVEDIVEQGNTAVLRWSVTATHRGAALQIPPTNRAVKFRGITWMEFQDEQLVRGWDSWNLGGLLQSLRL